MGASTAKRTRGYSKELLILPFDHRTSFQEKLFGIHGQPSSEQTELISSFKTMIFEGFEKALGSGLPKDQMGVLVDEQFGGEVIRRARQKGIIFCIAAEKSGQDEFDFEYPDYAQHIEKVNPTFVKVLVRYNPEGGTTVNRRQAGKLLELSQYLDRTNRLFIFELLVPATPVQLERCKGDKALFDVEMRPSLMVRAIEELQKTGIEPDVWKLEGLERKEDCQKVCDAARAGGRDNVGCIVLGRGENEAKVCEWLKVGARVKGVIGFAVGRTVFWEPLKAFKEKKVSRDQAVEQIAKNYGGFCKLWLEARA